jgi:phage terminase Nu1 subunit (DNA packaging protein)
MSKTLEPEELMTRDAIARLIGRVPSTITKLAIDGVLPVETGGGPGRQALFKPSAVVAAHIRAIEARYAGHEGLNPANERARRDHHQALLAEQLHKKRSGEMLLTEDVGRAWSSIVLAIRSALLRLPRSVAAACAAAATPDEVERLLTAEVRTMLTELSRWEPPVESTDTPPGPTRSKRKERKTS